MPGAVYLLSAGTALACGFLLLRAWRSKGVRLLFWSGLCFLGLALDNILLYLDLVILPDVQMYNAPSLAGLISICLLLYGLIWDAT